MSSYPTYPKLGTNHPATPSQPGEWSFCTTCFRSLSGGTRHLRTRPEVIDRRAATWRPAR
jgi:hypothetical protein